MGNIPENGVALYRVMTEKSKIGFGKYTDLTVGDILKINPQYVVWLYANYEKISLHKRIIEQLGIREIKKPGTDPEVLKEWQRAKTSQFSKEERDHFFMIKAKARKNRAMAEFIRVRRNGNMSKAELQGINHGKGSRRMEEKEKYG